MFVFATLLFTWLSAAPNVQGLVTDAATERPIANATVRIPDLERTTYTDRNGFFVFSEVPEGRWEVHVSAPSYQDHDVVVLISGRNDVRLELSLMARPIPPAFVQGRVEDASTGEPIQGARVFHAEDPAIAAVTDAVGRFTLQFSSTDSLDVYVERLGYLAQHYKLPSEATTRLTILLLEPHVLELDGLTAVGEPAIDLLLEDFARRRNANPGAVLDRMWLDRFARGYGTVWDLVRSRVPRVSLCPWDSGQLCVPGRVRTFRNPFPLHPLMVCVDGVRSLSSKEDLENLPVQTVALIELHGRSGVKVYTPGWVVSRARYGMTFLSGMC